MPIDNGLIYFNIFNAISDKMVFTEFKSGKIIEVNDAWIKATGFDHEKSIGKTAYELDLWAKPAERNTCIDKFNREGCIVNFEASLMMKEQIIPHLISTKFVENEEIRYVLWEFRDISEQKRLNDSLTKSDALRKSVFDYSRVPIIVMDALTFKYIDCNSAAVEIYRFSTREEILSKSPVDFSAPTQYDGTLSVEKARYYIEKALTEGAVVFEWRHKSSDGEIWDAEVHLMSFKSGERRFLQFTLQDITERKRTSDALKESEERYRALVENLPIGIVVAYEDIIAYSNYTIGRMLGVSDEKSLIGKSIFDFIPEEYRESVKYRRTSLNASHQVASTVEGKIKTNDGKEIFIESQAVKISYKGKPAILNIINDITERKNTEEHMRLLNKTIEIASDGIYWMNPEGRIIYVNDAGCTMLGYTRNELLEMQISDINPKVNAKSWSDMWKILHEGKIFIKESEHRRKDGSTFPIEVVSTYIKLGDKEYNSGFARDITERKRAESALRLEKEFNQTLIQLSPAFIVVIGFDGRTIFMNNTMLNTLGYELEEVENKDYLSTFIPEADRHSIEEIFAKILKHREITINTNRVLTKDKRILTCEWRGLPVFSDETHNYFIGFGIDISERIHKEHALHESEERFRQIAENIQEIFFLYEKEGDKLLYISPVIKQLFGVDAETVYADNTFIDRLVHPEDIPKVDFIHPERFYSKPLNEEFRIILPPDGLIRWIRMRSFLIRNEQNEVIRVAGLAADVTEFKDAQEKTRKQEMQLLQADKLASLGIIAAGIAHEINNPNNFIMLNAPLIKKIWENVSPIIESHCKENGDFFVGSMNYSQLAPSVVPLIDGILQGSKRIQKIVSSLKEYSRQDVSNIKQNVDLNIVVQSALLLLENYCKKHTKELQVDYANQPLFFKGDFQRLEQVIINLIQNACDALTSILQAITIKTMSIPEKNSIAFIISDQGVGIRPEDMSKIIDPFFTTKINQGGTGLGLSISSGIVKEHNGNLFFESQYGKGTTATLELPWIHQGSL